MIRKEFKLAAAALAMTLALTGCGRPAMQFREAQLPSGAVLTTPTGEEVVMGARTKGGSGFDANYDAVTNPTPVSQAYKAQVVTVVQAPTVVEQGMGIVTGVGSAAGNVMGGIAAINYSRAALDNNLADNFSVTGVSSSASDSAAEGGAANAASASTSKSDAKSSSTSKADAKSSSTSKATQTQTQGQGQGQGQGQSQGQTQGQNQGQGQGQGTVVQPSQPSQPGKPWNPGHGPR